MTEKEFALAVLNVLAGILKSGVSPTLQSEIEQKISEQIKKL